MQSGWTPARAKMPPRASRVISLVDEHTNGGGVQELHAGQVQVDEEIALIFDQICEHTARGRSSVDVQVSIDGNDDPVPYPA